MQHRPVAARREVVENGLECPHPGLADRVHGRTGERHGRDAFGDADVEHLGIARVLRCVGSHRAHCAATFILASCCLSISRATISFCTSVAPS